MNAALTPTDRSGAGRRNWWTCCLRPFEADPRKVDGAARLLGRAVAASGLLLVLATGPLWKPQTVFPRIPLLSFFRTTPRHLDWLALGTALAGLAAITSAGPRRAIGRWGAALFLAALALLVLTDQHRLQPWAYQFACLALLLAFLPAGEAIAWSRLLVVSIYFYSALSKLDASFVEAGGGAIGDGLFRVLHLAGNAVPHAAHRALGGLLPIAELLLAAGLTLKRFRRVALGASLAMHGFLIAALGPWGADHQPAVLMWNAFFIVQNLILFGWAGDRSQCVASEFGAASPGRAAVRIAATIVLFFPATMSIGWCDAWPGWAVYATGSERMRVYVDAFDRDRLPAEVRSYVEPPRFRDDRCLVRIDRWSLD